MQTRSASRSAAPVAACSLGAGHASARRRRYRAARGRVTAHCADLSDARREGLLAAHPAAGAALPRALPGRLISHNAGGSQCPGSGQPPAEDPALACWLPVLPGLTPHGLRHGHQTWMEEAGIGDLLRSERMGHEVPGMRGVYGHVSPAMRAELKAMLQERWETSLGERTRLSQRSVVPALDALLAAQSEPATKIRSRLAPRNGHSQRMRP